MATVEENLRTILFSDAGVGALVGSTELLARIYFNVMKQDTVYPAIQIEKITTVRSHNLAGGVADYNKDTYQISCWADGKTGFSKALELSDAVLTALDGKLATATLPAIVAGVETHLYDSNARVHQIALDFSVMR